MLAEFKYGGVPKETFAWLPFIKSQDIPRSWFYYLKKDFFPWVYWNSYVKVGLPLYSTSPHSAVNDMFPQGKWFGPKGWLRPVHYHKDITA